jgi:hypothetical protein
MKVWLIFSGFWAISISSSTAKPRKNSFWETRSVRAQLGTHLLGHSPRLVCELLNVEDSAAAPRVVANYSTQCSCHSSSSNCARIIFLCFTETQIRFVEQPTHKLEVVEEEEEKCTSSCKF